MRRRQQQQRHWAASLVCRFFEWLPTPADWSLMIKALVLFSGNYRTFLQQCRENALHLTSSTQGCVLRKATRHKARSKRAVHEQDQHNKSARRSVCERALEWQPLARFYHKWTLYFYLYCLVKYRLLAYIQRNVSAGVPSLWLGDLRPLDCFIPGRIHFLGRSNMIANEVGCVFFLWFLVYRLAIHRRVPHFKFYALEFLMTHRADALRHRPGVYRSTSDSGKEPQPGASLSRTTRTNSQRRPTGRAQVPLGVNSIAYLRSPFVPLNERPKWILRPNRTPESWLRLVFFIKVLAYYTIPVTAFALAFTYWTLGGPLLTNLGFEISHSACLAWLRDTQAANANGSERNGENYAYSYIYKAPGVVAHEFSIERVPARIPVEWANMAGGNAYHRLRLLLDLVENHLVFSEYIILLTCQCYLVMIQSYDVALNASCIRTRLRKLIHKLETRLVLMKQREEQAEAYSRLQATVAACCHCYEHETRAIMGSGPRGKGPGSGWARDNLATCNNGRKSTSDRRLHLVAVNEDKEDEDVNENLAEEIDSLQAILADHFNVVTRGYNAFTSFLVCVSALLWLHYTLVLCNWITMAKSPAVELEFLVTESSVTSYVLFVMTPAALVWSQNMQLYRLIASAMALDQNWAISKRRWTTIIKYFHPKPHFCFSILGHTEISWLFSIKLLSWILSAFVVLANFYHAERFGHR